MRLETKFVQVPNDPATINAINNLAAVWGWTVQSIQVTDSKISYEGDSSGWITDYGYYGTKEIITEHTNYASITYQRDMDNPKYQQLSTLEQSYNDCDEEDFLTQEEQQRYDAASEETYKATKKYKRLAIITGVLTAYVLLIVTIALKSPIPILAGIGLTIYFGRKAATYSNPACHTLNDLNRARRFEKKQDIIKKAQSI